MTEARCCHALELDTETLARKLGYPDGCRVARIERRGEMCDRVLIVTEMPLHLSEEQCDRLLRENGIQPPAAS